jgi:hypothetical protein
MAKADRKTAQSVHGQLSSSKYIAGTNYCPLNFNAAFRDPVVKIGLARYAGLPRAMNSKRRRLSRYASRIRCLSAEDPGITIQGRFFVTSVGSCAIDNALFERLA